MSGKEYFVEEPSKFECQDVFFPKPLPKPNSTKREILIDYGSCGHVYIDNTSGKTPISEKQYFFQNKLSAKYPTLPLAETALMVDYPFRDRVMGDNLNSIKKARNLVYYMNRYRGLWVSKVPFSLLNPLKRVIEEMKTADYDLKHILKEKASPILRSHIENYHYLLQKGSVESYNSAYVGGCLTALKTDTGDCTVCFPSGPKFTNLNVRQIIPDEKDPYFYQYNDGIEMNIGHSIYEVRSTTIRGTGYCALRCGSNRCHLLRFQGENFNSTVNIIETVNETPTSICPSPYIEGESLIATDSGTVHIWRVGKGLDAVILNNPKRFKCNDDWRQVHYGGCPQEIVIADRTVLKMFDRRTKCESSIDMFALPNNILLNSERISATCKHPVNPFQHITCTDYSLLVTDQRFPGHTVMYWNHILEKCPALLSVYNDDNDSYNNSLVLLASQYPAETCCFQFQQNSNEPVQSTQTPWRLSKISDIREFDCPMLNTYSLLSEKRLDTSLCGVAALPGFDKQSLLTLQLDSHGELFYQVYSEKANDMGDLTCSAGPGNSTSFFSYEAQERAKTWMLSLESHVNQFCEKKNIVERSVFNNSNLLPKMMNIYPPNELCPICQPGTQEFERNVEDVIDDAPCPACGLTFKLATSLCDAEKEEKIADISCDGFEEFCNQIPSYEKFPHESARSNIFIKLWLEDSDISEYVKKADKDTRKYKAKFKEKQKALIKRVEKRRERFRILRRHGHDINSIYFKNRKDPSKLDKSIKALASQYPEDDEETSAQQSNVTKTLSSFESQRSQQPEYTANITRLLQDSHNLSRLQELPSSCSSSFRSDSVYSNKQRKGKKSLDTASEPSSQILTGEILDNQQPNPLSPISNRKRSKTNIAETLNRSERLTSESIQEDSSLNSETIVKERKSDKKKSVKNEPTQLLGNNHVVAEENLNVTSTKKNKLDKRTKGSNSDTEAKSDSSHIPEMHETPLEAIPSKKKGKRNSKILSSEELEEGHQLEVSTDKSVKERKSKSKRPSKSHTLEFFSSSTDEASVISTKSKSKNYQEETYSDMKSPSLEKSEKKKSKKSKSNLDHVAPEIEDTMSISSIGEQDSPEIPIEKTKKKREGTESLDGGKYEKNNDHVEKLRSPKSETKKRKSEKSNKILDIENVPLQEPTDEESSKKNKSKKKRHKDLSDTESACSQKSSGDEYGGREFSPEVHVYKQKSKKKKKKKKYSDSESDSSLQYSSDNSTTYSKKKSKRNKKGSDYDYDSSSSHKSTDSATLSICDNKCKNKSKHDSDPENVSKNKHIIATKKDKKKSSKSPENSTLNEIFKVPFGLPPRRNRRSGDKASKKLVSPPSSVDENISIQEEAFATSTIQLEAEYSQIDNEDDHLNKKLKMKKKKKRRKDPKNDVECSESDASVESYSSVSSFDSEISLFSNPIDNGETANSANPQRIISEASGDEHRQSRNRKKRYRNSSASDDHLDSNDGSVCASDQDSGSDQSQKKKRKKKRKLTSTSQDPNACRDPDEIDNTLRSRDVHSSTIPANRVIDIPKKEVSDINRKHRKNSSSQSVVDTIVSDIRSETDLDTQRSLPCHSREPSADNDQSHTNVLAGDDSNNYKSLNVLQHDKISQNLNTRTVTHVTPNSSRVMSDQIPIDHGRDTKIDKKSFGVDCGVHPEYTGDIVIGYVYENVDGDSYVEAGNSKTVDNCRRTRLDNSGTCPQIVGDVDNDADKKSASQANISSDNTSRGALRQKSKIDTKTRHTERDSYKESNLVNNLSNDTSHSTFPPGSHHNVRTETEKTNREESADLNLSFSPHSSSSPYIQLQHKPELRTKSKTSKKKKTKFAIGF